MEAQRGGRGRGRRRKGRGVRVKERRVDAVYDGWWRMTKHSKDRMGRKTIRVHKEEEAEEEEENTGGRKGAG